MKKLSLPIRIMLGMALGILVGSLVNVLHKHFPSCVWWDTEIAQLGGVLFLNMFRMIVVPVVLISMIRGVTSMKSFAFLGRVGIKTLLIFAVTTIISSLLGILASYAIGIGKGCAMELPVSQTIDLQGKLQSVYETLADIVPTNMFQSVVEADMLQIIFIAIIGGIAISSLNGRLSIIEKILEELDMLNIKIVELTLHVAPYGVFCLLTHTFADFGFSVLLPLTKYILCIVVSILLLLFGIYPLMLRFMAGVSPANYYRKFAPVMMVAFSTSSSNATLSVNVEATSQKIGVDKSIASFILSLGATINMNGTAIMQGCAAVLVSQLYGVNLSTTKIIQIIVMCLIASVGTAGMPSAGVVMLGLVLESVGLPLSGLALVLGVDRLVDMFRTVANITGDSVTAVVVASSEDQLDRSLLER